MRPKRRKDFAIAIICALPLEAEAVEALFDEHYDRLGEYYSKQQGDANAYINGRIGKHDVVLCYMPGIGKGSAASVASNLRVSYIGIKLALVVGICGGAPPPPKYQEIFLGDVIISDSVIEYDFGRQYPGGFQRKAAIQDTLGSPSQEIRALLNGLRTENARSELQDRTQQYLHILQQKGSRWRRPRVNDILFKASYLHKHYSHTSSGCYCSQGDSPDDICKEALEMDCDKLKCDISQKIRYREISGTIQTSIYIGPVASADTVMKSGLHRDEIVSKENVIGFEMEGAGVRDNVPSIIIKGVCDYADSHKSKSWQAYAAATGASAAKAFLEIWRPANEVICERMMVQSKIQIPKSVFFGRERELNRLSELFDLTIATRQTAVIWGLNGYGKTQLALEYITTRRAQYESILWIESSSRAMIEQSCENICSQLAPNTCGGRSAVDALLSWLEQGINSSWIMVFDGVESLDDDDSINDLDIRTFFPSCDHGHILLITTSLDLHLRLRFPDIPVRNVDDQTGAKILMSCAGGNVGDSSTQMKAMAISRKLGGMPLAIQQAGSFLSYGMISLSDYNQKFHMRYLDKTLKAPLRKYVGSYEKGRTVWTTFDILYSALVQRSLDAIQLLTLTSFLGRGRIPISTISGKGIHNKNPWDPLYPVPTPSGKKGHVPELLQWLSEVRSDIDRVALAVSELERSGFALLHRGADGIAIESIFIHDLARSFIRSKVPQQSLSDVLVASFLISGLQLYDGCSIPSETLLRKHMGRLVEVLDLFLTGIPDHMLAPDGQYFRLCAVVAPVYARICRFQGRLDTAANLWTIALQDKFVPDMNGAERDMTREHYMEAAKIDIRLGNYKDAIDKYSMVVTSSETGHQQDDELAIQAASYLRQARERYEQHKQDLERAVTAFSTPKAVRHNISHAVTHGTIHDLGNLCSDQGKLEEAEEMYQRALAGRENIYTLDTVYNLGCIYSDQGKLEKAEDMYQRALLGYKEALGPDHTSTLDTVYNLGCLYSDQGKLEDAEEMYQRALAGREKVLGPDHTSTLDTVYNLGNFYSQQGKLDEAEEMYQRALAGYKKALGPDHTSTLDTANNLAYLYFDQGKLEEAEKMYQ